MATDNIPIIPRSRVGRTVLYRYSIEIDPSRMDRWSYFVGTDDREFAKEQAALQQERGYTVRIIDEDS